MSGNRYEQIINEMSEWGNTLAALSYLAKQICLLNNWSYAEIWCPDNKGNFLTWAGYWGKNEIHFEKFSKYSSYFKFGKGIGLIGKTWEEKKLIMNDDIINDKSFLRNDVAVKSRFYAAAGIPIIKNDEAVSVICIFFEKIDAKEITELTTLYNYLNSTTERKLP